MKNFNMSVELPVFTGSQIMPELADIGEKPTTINVSDDDDDNFMKKWVRLPTSRMCKEEHIYFIAGGNLIKKR